MVYVTHDWSEALAIGDRLFVLAEGKVRQQGTPREVYVRPASPAVARQLGLAATNIFPVTVAEGKVRRPEAGDSPGWRSARSIRSSLLPRPRLSWGSGLRISTGRRETAGAGARRRGGGTRVSVLAEWGGEPIHLALERAADRRHREIIYPRPRMDRGHLVAAVSRNEKPAQWVLFLVSYGS